MTETLTGYSCDRCGEKTEGAFPENWESIGIPTPENLYFDGYEAHLCPRCTRND